MTTQSTVYPDTNVPTPRKATGDGRTVVDALESEGSEAKGKLRHMVEAGKARVTEWKGGLEDGIREKPIQSILIAAGVGAVIGLLVGRRSR